LNAVPALPFAEVLLVIVGAVAKTEIVRVPLPVPPALVALIATVDIPALLGVPLITPVAVLIVSPAGRPLAPYDVGLLLPVIV